MLFACFPPRSVGQLCEQHGSHKIKQLQDLLKTTGTFAWSQYFAKALVSFGAIRRFIVSYFANQNFSRDRKAVLLRKWIALVLQVTFRFMGCLVQANTLVSGIDSIVVIMTVSSIIAFTKQSSAERYLANIFSPVFL